MSLYVSLFLGNSTNHSLKLSKAFHNWTKTFKLLSPHPYGPISSLDDVRRISHPAPAIELTDLEKPWCKIHLNYPSGAETHWDSSCVFQPPIIFPLHFINLAYNTILSQQANPWGLMLQKGLPTNHLKERKSKGQWMQCLVCSEGGLFLSQICAGLQKLVQFLVPIFYNKKEMEDFYITSTELLN